MVFDEILQNNNRDFTNMPGNDDHLRTKETAICI